MSLDVVVLSGNPRPGSRTTAAAVAVARSVVAGADLDVAGNDVRTVELATLAPQVLAPTRTDVDEALAVVARADLLVVATPVYKASYTGLLKAFLDLYGPDGLGEVVAVPVVVSASPAHGLAGEAHLRPLLVELGATVPTRVLTLVEAQLGDPAQRDDAVAGWWARARRPLVRALGGTVVS